MSKSGIIDRADLLSFALPRLELGVSKTRIVEDYTREKGIRVTRQALDYHLDKENAPGTDIPKGDDQTSGDGINAIDQCDSTSATTTKGKAS